MATPESVFLVHHVHEMPSGEEDVKLIGVYASQEDAEKAVARAKQWPGFKDHPEGFEISSCVVGRDHWTEGFVTLFPEDM